MFQMVGKVQHGNLSFKLGNNSTKLVLENRILFNIIFRCFFTCFFQKPSRIYWRIWSFSGPWVHLSFLMCPSQNHHFLLSNYFQNHLQKQQNKDSLTPHPLQSTCFGYKAIIKTKLFIWNLVKFELGGRCPIDRC